MVSLEEMKKKRKIKVLLKGLTGVGKTLTCMKIVDVALQSKKEVLYLDHERGATEEIIKYFEDNNITDLEHFYHEDYVSFTDLLGFLKNYTIDKEKKVDLIIIDPLPLLQICRISATNEIKNQGFYYQGEKVVKLEEIKDVTQFSQRIDDGKVDNKITYSMRGWQYSLPNLWELTFKDMLVSLPPDIVVALCMPDNKNTLDPIFDFVLDLSVTQETEQHQEVINGKLETKYITKTVYKGIPRKIRGSRIMKIEEMTDPWKAIIKPFCRKYLGKECEEK